MAEPAHNMLVDDGSDVANVLQELAVLALETRPSGPQSHNKYSSPLTCNHDEPTIRAHSN
jgi:hypothetical protein